MNLKLAPVVIVLCLTACATPSVKDDAPANDLDAYLMNVKREGKPRVLPNGKEYCAEFATTEKEQDACMGQLEDGLYRANRSIESLVGQAEKFVHRMKRLRNPCNWFTRAVLRRPRCATTPPAGE